MVELYFKLKLIASFAWIGGSFAWNRRNYPEIKTIKPAKHSGFYTIRLPTGL